MEHRLFERKPTHETVGLFQQGKFVAAVMARDISLAGMSIENPGISLHIGQVVEVRLPNQTELIPALVVHHEAHSTGFMFAHL